MKEAIAKRWVKALRSGRYKQGRQALRSGDKFCCLGVLCTIVRAPKFRYLDDERYYFGEPALAAFLPQSVVDKVGMKTFNGSLDPISPLRLAFLNDHGYSFEAIADVIEEHWQEL